MTASLFIFSGKVICMTALCEHSESADRINHAFYGKPIREECGVFGVFSEECADVASLAYYGLYALQHQGEAQASS